MKSRKKYVMTNIRQNALSYRPLCSVSIEYMSYKQIAVDTKIKCVFMENRVAHFNLHLWKKSWTQF